MQRCLCAWIMSIGLAAGILVWGPSASAQEAMTVQGEIVDLACYMSKGSRGPAHKSCAQMCAKRGVPLAVLTDAGELYLLLDDHDKPEGFEAAKRFAGERAEVNGTRFNKPRVNSIVVSAVKAL